MCRVWWGRLRAMWATTKADSSPSRCAVDPIRWCFSTKLKRQILMCLICCCKCSTRVASNIGTRELKDFGAGVGFNTAITKERSEAVIRKALNRQFSPEFLNRVDDIITFSSLDHESILKIVDIELASFFKRVDQLGYTLEITDAAKQFVADKGFDIQFGARPLKRAIQSPIEDPLCEMLLLNENKSSGKFVIDLKDDAIHIQYVEPVKLLNVSE